LPSGRTHDRVTLWSLPVIAGATIYLTSRADLAFWVSGGFLFSGLIFGPDLDLYSYHYQRWGKLKLIWRPYQKAIKHRSIWSHGPIVGTIGRMVYLGAWLSLGGIFLLGIVQLVWGHAYSGGDLVGILQHSTATNYPVYLALFCGLELGAMSHYSSDWVVSKYKRLPIVRRWMGKPPTTTKSKSPRARKPKVSKGVEGRE
jgi:uncharacterized metal-binding protein